MIFALSFFVSATMTSIITSSPENNSWTNNNQTDFNFTAISNVSLTFGCTLVVDGVVYAGNVSVDNNTETTLTPVSELSDGTLEWFVNCTDGELNSSENKTLNLDATMPALVSGLAASTSADGSVSVSWTAVTLDVNGNNESNVSYQLFRTTNISALNTSDSAELLETTNLTEYVDDAIVTGTNYSYVVTSYDNLSNENTEISTNNVSIVPSACTTDYGEWSAWSLCHSSERERTRTRTCYGGGATTDTDTMMCTRASVGGSGSSAGPTTQSSPSFADKTWSVVVANQENIATVSNDASPVLNVKFIVNKGLSNVRLIINEQTTTPDVGAPKSDVYKYISIEKEVLTNEDIVSAIITFKINKSWLVENEFESNRVVLQRFADGEWTDLETNMYQEDEDFAYFRASTPGFSYFAITASEVFSTPDSVVGMGVVEEQNITDLVNETEQFNESQEQVEVKESSIWIWWVIIIVLAAVAVYFGWKEYSEREERRLRNERILATIRKVEEARKFEQSKFKATSKVTSKPFKPIKKVKRK